LQAGQFIDAAKPKMQKVLDFITEELKSIRTGRANTALVEDVKVSVYEQDMSLKQLAQLSTPDGKTITVAPWDQATLEPIEKAIREDKSLDLNPINDGKALHINVPPLTTERREQMVKQINEKIEQANVSLRNVRHEIINDVKKAKDSGLSEDDVRWAQNQLDKLVDEFKAQIEQTAEQKRQEIMSV